jgi:hypothetical protein
MRRGSQWTLVLAVSTVVLGSIQQAGAVLNNGFETDYAYITKEDGTLRSVRETDGATVIDLAALGLPPSLTFSGTGGNDARLFTARPIDTDADTWANDVVIEERNPDGTVANSVNLSALASGFPTPAGHGMNLGTIRYNPLSNTLFVSVNPDFITATSAGQGHVKVYEFNLGLTQLLHTYVGPTETWYRNPTIAINSRNGKLYLVGQNLSAPTPGVETGQGDLVSFVTAGRPVGGTTTTYTTLVEGSTMGGNWTHPRGVIFRKRTGTGSDDTLVILMNNASAGNWAEELWLDTTAHPVDGNGNLAVRNSTLFFLKRGFCGQQDGVTGHIWLGAARGGYHVLRADGTTASYDTTRNYIDGASPFHDGSEAPVIVEVSPDPQSVPVGVPYVQQLSLQVGTPAPTWSVLQGPPGMQVDSTGKVTGWTPTAADMGLLFTLNIQATNSAGSDTESWQVRVLPTNNGFITDYVYMVRRPDNGGQVRKYNRSDGTRIEPDLLPDGTGWMTATFSGKGKGNDARLFVAKLISGTDSSVPGLPPESTGTDIVFSEIDYTGTALKTAKLSTIIGGPVGSAVVLGNLRYSIASDTLFVGLNPNAGSNSTAVAYEINLGLTTRIHTYQGELIPASVAAYDARVTVAVNRRNGMLYMASQSMGDATGAGLGDILAFNTAGRVVGGTTSTFAVLIDGQTCNGGNTGYIQPSSPIYRKRAGGHDTLMIPTNNNSNTPVLEFYLNTTLHPVDGNGNLAERTDNPTPLSIGRGWNGQQDIGSGEVWLGADHYGIHLIAGNDSTASYETGRLWMDAAVPPFVPCSEPFADMDADGDVDQADFAIFQLCYTGALAPGSNVLSLVCACADLGDDDNNIIPDRDGDIDAFDASAFESCATGPGIPANPTCGE